MSDIIKLSSPETEEFWKIPILFEDDRLLALNKPSHLLTSPDRDNPERPNLMKLLHRDIARGAPWVRERQVAYLANAHRLDFETSGVILLAKEKPVLIALADQFGSEGTVSSYVALVHGTPAEDIFKVELKLAPHPVEPGVMRVDEKQGKKSRTQFETLERFSGYTLMKCLLSTGRKHQIRVHLQRSRLPVVGDSLYGGKPLLLSTLKSGYRLKPKAVEKPLLDRVALHAESLAFVHPANATSVTIAAPWPKDLTVAVKYLRRYAG
jgi:RluA family pseudouridine synthase